MYVLVTKFVFLAARAAHAVLGHASKGVEDALRLGIRVHDGRK